MKNKYSLKRYFLNEFNSRTSGRQRKFDFPLVFDDVHPKIITKDGNYDNIIFYVTPNKRKNDQGKDERYIYYFDSDDLSKYFSFKAESGNYRNVYEEMTPTAFQGFIDTLRLQKSLFDNQKYNEWKTNIENQLIKEHQYEFPDPEELEDDRDMYDFYGDEIPTQDQYLEQNEAKYNKQAYHSHIYDWYVREVTSITKNSFDIHANGRLLKKGTTNDYHFSFQNERAMKTRGYYDIDKLIQARENYKNKQKVNFPVTSLRNIIGFEPSTSFNNKSPKRNVIRRGVHGHSSSKSKPVVFFYGKIYKQVITGYDKTTGLPLVSGGREYITEEPIWISAENIRTATEKRSEKNSHISQEEYNIAHAFFEGPNAFTPLQKSDIEELLKPDTKAYAYEQAINKIYGTSVPKMMLDGEELELEAINIKKAWDYNPGQTGRGEYLMSAIFPHLVVVGGSAAEAGVDLIHYANPDIKYEVKEPDFRVGVKSVKPAIEFSNFIVPHINYLIKQLESVKTKSYKNLMAMANSRVQIFLDGESVSENIGKEELMEASLLKSDWMVKEHEIVSEDLDIMLRIINSKQISMDQWEKAVAEYFKYTIDWCLDQCAEILQRSQSLEVAPSVITDLVGAYNYYDISFPRGIQNTDQYLDLLRRNYVKALNPEIVLSGTTLMIVGETHFRILTPGKLKELVMKSVNGQLEKKIASITSGGAGFDLKKIYMEQLDADVTGLLDTNTEESLGESINRWVKWATRK